MLNAGFQYLEQRDANDVITKDGVVGKNSPFSTSDNSGIYDIIAENLRWLKDNVDDVKDTSDLEVIKQSVTDMYNEMKNDPSFGATAAKTQAEEAKKQAQAALESATNAKTYRDDVVTKSTEVNDTVAEIKEYIGKAEKLVDSNKTLDQSISDYATVATNKANEASTSATNAATSEANATTSAANAKASETSAKTSADNAAKSASDAATSASSAATSAANARTSEANAKTSESNASSSSSNASTSATSAKSYMDTAKEYMQKAQEALAATQATQSIVDTAKANAEKCLADVEAVKESLAKMITYQGSVDNYSDLPTSPQVGYSYNIKNTDKEHGVNAGDNVVWNGTDWDNFGSYVDMSLFAELGKDARFNEVTAMTFTGDLKGNADTATHANDVADATVNMTASTKENGQTVTASGVIDELSSLTGSADLTSMSNLRSFVGSVHNNSGGNNVISVRHRNGAGDGQNYGLLMYSNLTNTDSIKYKKQSSGRWTEERTLLDSSNYNNFVPKIIKGIIIAFSGTFDSNGYPIDPDTNAGDTGWHICDGTNGTPDLRGRFILGASDSHAAGSTGGEEDHRLTINEMPMHNHDTYVDNDCCAVLNRNNNPWKQGLVNSSDSGTGNDYLGTSTKNATYMRGGSQPHNNMPPYYALSYIMKI